MEDLTVLARDEYGRTPTVRSSISFYPLCYRNVTCFRTVSSRSTCLDQRAGKPHVVGG